MAEPERLQIEIRAFRQLGACPAEPLAQALAAELIGKGWSRSNPLLWDDDVVAAWSPTAQRFIGVLVWRAVPHLAAACVVLGGVATEFRRQGVYGRLWGAFVEALAARAPEIRSIDSAYHVENEASAAMHRALGRRVEAVITSYDLTQHRSARHG